MGYAGGVFREEYVASLLVSLRLLVSFAVDYFVLTFATVSFVYDTPTAQVYTGEMDSLIGQSTNLDDEPVTP